MLYNPDWSKPETKADPFKLDTLIAWLEKQPADKAYNYVCNGHCMLAQYFTASGYPVRSIGAFHFSVYGGGDERFPLPEDFNDIAVGRGVRPEKPDEWTFGAALERARALQASND